MINENITKLKSIHTFFNLDIHFCQCEFHFFTEWLSNNPKRYFQLTVVYKSYILLHFSGLTILLHNDLIYISYIEFKKIYSMYIFK